MPARKPRQRAERSDKGVPVVLTDELRERVAAHVEAGHSYRAATGQEEVHWSTHSWWMRQGRADLSRGESTPFAAYARCLEVARAKAMFRREAELLALRPEQDGTGVKADPAVVRLMTQWLERLGDDVPGNEWATDEEIAIRVAETIHERIAATLPALRAVEGCTPSALAEILRILGGVGAGEDGGRCRGDGGGDAGAAHLH